jgi:hypothetical protein
MHVANGSVGLCRFSETSAAAQARLSSGWCTASKACVAAAAAAAAIAAAAGSFYNLFDVDADVGLRVGLNLSGPPAANFWKVSQHSISIIVL